MALTLPSIGAPGGPTGWAAALNAALTVLDQRTERELSGTGSPEGVRTAGVGATYRDTAATNGAVLWVKATGSGNTGWRVVYGDTGWRNVTSLLTGSVGAGSVHIRRIAQAVHLSVDVAPSVNGGSVTLTFPSGFNRSGRWDYVPHRHSASLTVGFMHRTNTSSTVGGGSYQTSWGNVQLTPPPHITDDAWPSTLPGVAS